MKKLLLLAGLLICLVSPILNLAAHADTISTFTLTGTTGKNDGFGSFTVNTTTGVVQAVNFDFSGRASYTSKTPLSPGDVFVDLVGGFTYVTDSYVDQFGGAYSAVYVVVPVTSFVGYTGGAICSLVNPCNFNSAILNQLHSTTFQSGQLSTSSVLVTAPTPEPSSISYLLLSVACVASIPFLRRRVLQDCA